jgi:hypothetical protein
VTTRGHRLKERLGDVYALGIEFVDVEVGVKAANST